ncbi:MAG: Fic family protein [Chlamydiae bacterium]|nr:Fic family protein [Chlamydiota bacterium]
MKDLLLRIEEKKGKFQAHQPWPMALVKNLDEWFKIELTYTSNAIEGNTLTRQETALIVEKGITVEGKSIREHLEAVNHAQAYEWIQKLVKKKVKDITEETILDIHSMILQNIDSSHAGRYRTVPVRIAGSTVIMPNARKVPGLMEAFISELKIRENSIEVAADAHFRLVSIHPFIDGNGRTARLLMNLILMQGGYPPAIIRKEDRRAYINSIEKGQLYGDLSDYYPLIFTAVERSLDIYLETLEPPESPLGIPPKLLKMGQLAKVTHETVPTIRYWTKEGLLKAAQHSKGGYQLYSEEMIPKIHKIRQLQKEKRLTIAELKRVLKEISY